MKRLWTALVAAGVSACAAQPATAPAGVAASPKAAISTVASTAAPLPDFDIPYTKMVLDNGLTLIVHEDHKAPIVAVNVWYHVGSKDEQQGKTGFAHLFEHLMFNGSENYKDEYFRPFERVGATGMNGTTWLDRTNYFENVPTTALDLALWMESDRMGHLLGAIDQKTLDEQRGVVQNEKRQGENEPYGKTWEWLQRASFPEGHPYRWETIGSMADLNAASLEDVKHWFQQYYGAANVTLVLAGDIDPATAKAKVQQYFGDIPAGPPVARRKEWIAPRSESTRDVMQDRVAQTRITRSWNAPPFGAAEGDLLQLVTRILGGGKSSRLYERLVYGEKLASTTSMSVVPFELASLVVMDADVAPGADSAKVEAAFRDELQRFIDQGPTDEEVSRARTSLVSEVIRGAEKIGGQGGKSDVLASCQVYTGNPGCLNDGIKTVEAATPKQLQEVARRWLSQGDYTLVIEPFADYKTTTSSVDRKKGPPVTTQFPDLSFPALQRDTLSNGIHLVLAERHDVPVVNFRLSVDAGYAADQGGKLGASAFTMAMLDEGTESLSTLEIARKLEDLGADFGAGSNLDSTSISMSALASRLPDSLALYADLILHPAFREADVQRLKGQWLAGIAQEKSDPQSLAFRTLPPLLYGEGHAYAIPATGTGTEASITSLTAEDLRAWHQRWIRPDQATLMIVGDTTLAQIKPQLESALGDWKAPATPAPVKNVATVALPAQPRVFLMDRPDAQQTQIFAALLAPSSKVDNALEIGTMSSILGGTFTSRLNMNLREDKHWAYGAGVTSFTAQGQRPFILYAPVQTDKTVESAAEMLKEARGFVGGAPATADEVEKIKQRNVRSLPGRFETSSAVMSAVADIVLMDRPDDYVQTLKDRTEAQTLAQVRAAAQQVIHPDQLTWLFVGDRAKIEAGVRKLNLGPVTLLDADGKPLP